MTKKQKACDHYWHYDYDCFEDAVSKIFDELGIPVKCNNCGLEGMEWWTYGCIRDKDTSEIITN